MNTPTFWDHVIHVVAQGIVWIVPFVFLAYPDIGKLTISAIGSIIVSYLNQRFLSGKGA